jgi:hypothetical protein
LYQSTNTKFFFSMQGIAYIYKSILNLMLLTNGIEYVTLKRI